MTFIMFIVACFIKTLPNMWYVAMVCDTIMITTYMLLHHTYA